MRTRHGLGGVMVIIIGLLVALPVQAQTPDEFTPEELDLIAYVAAAFDSLEQVESYTISGKQVGQVDMLAGPAGGLGMNIAGTLTVQIAPDSEGNIQGANASMSYRVDMQFEDEAITLAVDYQVIYFDFRQYMQLNIEAEGIDLGELGYLEVLNGVWFEMDIRDLFSEEEVAAGGLLDVDFQTLMETTGNRYASTFVVPVNTDSVLSIIELDSQTIEGRDLRVFQLEVSPEGMVTGQMGEFLDQIEQYAALASAMNPDDEEAAILANLSAFLESMKMDQRVWIDVEQNLPHRVILEYDYSEAFLLIMQLLGEDNLVDEMNFGVSSDVTYSDFDAPFEVELPDYAIPLPPEAFME